MNGLRFHHPLWREQTKGMSYERTFWFIWHHYAERTVKPTQCDNPKYIRGLLHEEHVAEFVLSSLLRGLFVSYELPIIYPITRRNGVIKVAKKASGNDKQKYGDWGGFVNVPVSPADFKSFQAWLKKEPDLFQLMDNLVGSKYKISIRYNDNNDNFMVSLSCYDPNSANYKTTMTSTGNGASMTVAFALWKHYELSAGVWSSIEKGMDGFS